MITDEIMEKIDNAEVICFDYFNTIVQRSEHEHVAINKWAKRIVEIYKLDVKPFELIELRNVFLSDLSPFSSIEEKDYSELCEYLYQLLFSKMGRQVNKKEFVDSLLDVEIEEEMKLQSSLVATRELIEYAKEIGKILVIITDFYLPKSAFEVWLSRFGLSDCFDEIFVSSEIHLRKSSGNIYNYVKDKMNASKYLMIGDNEISDIESAKKNGFDAFLVKSSIIHRCLAYEDILRYLKMFVLDGGVERKSAIQAYEFTVRLYKKLKYDDVDRVFFFSREGKIMKDLLDKYLELIGDSSIETKYMYISRKALYLASLKDNIEDELFSDFFSQVVDGTILEFLSFIDCYDEAVVEITRDIGIDLNKRISNIQSSLDLRRIITNERFKEYYGQKKKELSSIIELYVIQLGLSTEQTNYIVDIGWKGSIQKYLYLALNRKYELNGIYFGLNKSVKNEIGCSMSGIMFNYLDSNLRRYDVYYTHSLLLEHLYSANHGPTIGYEMKNKIVEPIIDMDKTNDVLYEIVRPIQENWINSMDEFVKVFQSSEYEITDFEKYTTSIFWKMCLCPKREERNVINSLQKIHSENWIKVQSRGEKNSFRDKIRINKILLIQVRREKRSICSYYNLFDKFIRIFGNERLSWSLRKVFYAITFIKR